jgi:hypothetical protein
MTTRRLITKQPSQTPVSNAWFEGKPITFLYTDGVRNFMGVRDSMGDVVSRVELRSDAAEARAQSISTAIDAEGDKNGIN